MCHSKLVSDRVKTTIHDFWVYYMSRVYYTTQNFPSLRREKGKQKFLQFRPTPSCCRVEESISWPCSQLSSCTLTSPKNTYPASKIPRVRENGLNLLMGTSSDLEEHVEILQWPFWVNTICHSAPRAPRPLWSRSC